MEKLLATDVAFAGLYGVPIVRVDKWREQFLAVDQLARLRAVVSLAPARAPLSRVINITGRYERVF
jgi:hypothetical protein